MIDAIIIRQALLLATAAALLCFTGCSNDAGDDMPDSKQTSANSEDDQKIYPLTPKDLHRLKEQRLVVSSFLKDDASKKKYESAAGKLGAIQAILEAETFSPEQTHELQCLGVVLGDAFVQEMGLEWVIVEDQYGRDLAVRMPERSIFLFPITMISKRIEDGEQVDIFDLFNGVASVVEEKIQNKEIE